MQSLLTVTSPAESYDLTVLETVKKQLKIEDNVYDDDLAFLIHQRSSAISNFCDRVFAEETVSEVFRLGSGFNFSSWHVGGWADNVIKSLILRRRPVTVINSVDEDGVVVDPSEYELDSEAGILYRLSSEDFRTTWKANKVTVEYVSGYKLLENLPFDLEKACLLWIEMDWRQRGRDAEVRSEDVPGMMRKEYFDPNRLKASPPPRVMELLNNYMEVVIR